MREEIGKSYLIRYTLTTCSPVYLTTRKRRIKMKRIIIFLLCLILFTVPCFAAEEASEVTTTEATTSAITTEKATEKVTEAPKTTAESKKETEKPKKEPVKEEVKEPVIEVQEDSSQPRLMVTSYKLEGDFIAPNETKTITVTLKNMHPSKSVKNIKLSLSEDSDEIRPTGMGTKYVSSIGADSYFSWAVELTAINTASIGEHKLSFTAEYEDKNGSGYSSSDILRVEVRQPARLEYDGAKLPVKVVQDDTVTLNIKLMNTGKAPLYNCKADFNIDGLDSGGSAYVGEIQPQESNTASANLLVSNAITGKVEGKITITYEDSFGETYTLTHDVSTKIEKKVIKAAKTEDEKEQNLNPLWWLFIIIGLAVGGGLGFGIPYAIRSRKERLRDEERL